MTLLFLSHGPECSHTTISSCKRCWEGSILVKGIAHMDSIRVLFQVSWRECVFHDNRSFLPSWLSLLDYSGDFLSVHFRDFIGRCTLWHFLSVSHNHLIIDSFHSWTSCAITSVRSNMEDNCRPWSQVSLVIDNVLDCLNQGSPSSSPCAGILKATPIPINLSLRPTLWAPLTITGMILEHPGGTASLHRRGHRRISPPSLLHLVTIWWVFTEMRSWGVLDSKVLIWFTSSEDVIGSNQNEVSHFRKSP